LNGEPQAESDASRRSSVRTLWPRVLLSVVLAAQFLQTTPVPIDSLPRKLEVVS